MHIWQGVLVPDPVHREVQLDPGVVETVMPLVQNGIVLDRQTVSILTGGVGTKTGIEAFEQSLFLLCRQHPLLARDSEAPPSLMAHSFLSLFVSYLRRVHSSLHECMQRLSDPASEECPPPTAGVATEAAPLLLSLWEPLFDQIGPICRRLVYSMFCPVNRSAVSVWRTLPDEVDAPRGQSWGRGFGFGCCNMDTPERHTYTMLLTMHAMGLAKLPLQSLQMNIHLEDRHDYYDVESWDDAGASLTGDFSEGGEGGDEREHSRYVTDILYPLRPTHLLYRLLVSPAPPHPSLWRRVTVSLVGEARVLIQAHREEEKWNSFHQRPTPPGLCPSLSLPLSVPPTGSSLAFMHHARGVIQMCTALSHAHYLDTTERGSGVRVGGSTLGVQTYRRRIPPTLYPTPFPAPISILLSYSVAAAEAWGKSIAKGVRPSRTRTPHLRSDLMVLAQTFRGLRHCIETLCQRFRLLHLDDCVSALHAYDSAVEGCMLAGCLICTSIPNAVRAVSLALQEERLRAPAPSFATSFDGSLWAAVSPFPQHPWYAGGRAGSGVAGASTGRTDTADPLPALEVVPDGVAEVSHVLLAHHIREQLLKAPRPDWQGESRGGSPRDDCGSSVSVSASGVSGQDYVGTLSPTARQPLSLSILLEERPESQTPVHPELTPSETVSLRRLREVIQEVKVFEETREREREMESEENQEDARVRHSLDVETERNERGSVGYIHSTLADVISSLRY
ncbi:hypothetical protein KIPB_001533 [Kipferlia bialata]|uniref:Uncharacterized protein n=1 Tax=Kipferlia bialata TaxID=797122 RepID=A0A9K3GG05_9EUKA|nr:hypothetical protein KIPB_001533 [Kipferlia bialata]|eukprot:g1533.t1